jgi:dGTPase
LNLTWETREGIIKHTTPCDHPSDAALQDYGPDTAPTLEAQIINIADEIAYNNHDIDDAVEAAFISFDDLRAVTLCEESIKTVEGKYPELPDDKKKYQTISTLIGYLIKDVVGFSEQNIKEHGIATLNDVKSMKKNVIAYSPRVEEGSKQLKDFLQHNVYRHYKVERMRIKAERYITLLFETYRDNPTLLPPKYRKRIKEDDKERVICDYIAGMTDRYALDEYKRLFEPYERV